MAQSAGVCLPAPRPSLLAPCGGFTLVELLVGMSLALMVMTAVLSTYVTLGRNFTRSLGLSSANQPALATQARRTLAYLAQDIRMASGIYGTPSASSLTLIIPTGKGTNYISYGLQSYDHDNDSLTADEFKLYRGYMWNAATSYVLNDTVVYNGVGYRCKLAHSNQAPPNATYWNLALPIHSNLLGCSFNYFDSSGNVYSAADLLAGNYLVGIKQISVSFGSQAGKSKIGTLTQVYQTDSPRYLLRNRTFLP